MTPRFRHALFPLLCLLATAMACANSKTPEPAGGETHFLHGCEGDSCGSGLDCICGVCSKPCLSDNTCKTSSALATCEPAGTPNGACDNPQASPVCDVTCTLDSDCSALGTTYTCESGSCRKLTTGSCTRDGVIYPANSRFMIECNTCTCSGGDLSCTQIACMDGGNTAVNLLPPIDLQCAVDDHDGGVAPIAPLTRIDRPALCEEAVSVLATPGTELVYNGRDPNSFELTSTDLFFFLSDNLGMVRTPLDTMISWTTGPLGSDEGGLIAAGFIIDGCDLFVANNGGTVTSSRLDGRAYRPIACCMQENIVVRHEQVGVDANHVYVSHPQNLYRTPREGGGFEVVRTRPAAAPWDQSFVLLTDRVVWIENETPARAALVSIPKDTTIPPSVMADDMDRLTAITSDATHLYFAMSRDGESGVIARIPLGGGTMETIRNTSDVALSIQVDSNQVYWLLEPEGDATNGRTLWKAGRSIDAEAIQIANHVDRFRIDDEHIYWSQTCGAIDGFIVRVPKGGL